MDDMPSIGDFSRPLVDQVKQPQAGQPPQPPSPNEQRLTAAEQKVATEAKQAEEQKKPLELYEQKLKEFNITREEAARIIDTYLMKGYYEEPFALTNRIKGAFRTRAYADTQRLQEHLERTRPAYSEHYQEAVFLYSTAASLTRLGNTVFNFPDPTKTTKEEIEKAFETRLAYIQSLGDTFVRLLYQKLSKFDEKVRAVLDEGALENF